MDEQVEQKLLKILISSNDPALVKLTGGILNNLDDIEKNPELEKLVIMALESLKEIVKEKNK